MRTPTKRIFGIAGVVVALIVIVPVGIWFSLKHEPTFYRELVEQPIPRVEEEAKRFEQDSLQFRNDIVNEPTWEGIFSDQEVNAWLVDGLMKHFADELPKEIHDPRVLFENDRILFAFKLDQGSVKTVISVVAQVAVPEDNVVSISLEKVRAGALPVSPQRIIDPLSKQAKAHGLELTWSEDHGVPVARVAYHAQKDRKDVVLERIHVIKGQIKLSGRSTREAGPVAGPRLPDTKVLQRELPKRNTQDAPPIAPEVTRSEAGPVR